MLNRWQLKLILFLILFLSFPPQKQTCIFSDHVFNFYVHLNSVHCNKIVEHFQIFIAQ